MVSRVHNLKRKTSGVSFYADGSEHSALHLINMTMKTMYLYNKHRLSKQEKNEVSCTVWQPKGCNTNNK